MKSQENASTEQQFKTYHLLFKKKYTLDSEEGINRYKIFKSNLKNIKEQNALTNSGKFGFNKFTDFTADEYLKFLTVTGSDETINFDALADIQTNEYDNLKLNA